MVCPGAEAKQNRRRNQSESGGRAFDSDMSRLYQLPHAPQRALEAQPTPLAVQKEEKIRHFPAQTHINKAFKLIYLVGFIDFDREVIVNEQYAQNVV